MQICGQWSYNLVYLNLENVVFYKMPSKFIKCLMYKQATYKLTRLILTLR